MKTIAYGVKVNRFPSGFYHDSEGKPTIGDPAERGVFIAYYADGKTEFGRVGFSLEEPSEMTVTWLANNGHWVLRVILSGGGLAVLQGHALLLSKIYHSKFLARSYGWDVL